MAGETWIGDLLGYKDIKNDGGATFPRRSVIDFVGAVTVTDDPALKKTVVTVLAPGGEGSSAPVEYKAPVRVASVANLALSGLVTLDGVTLNENDRVLAKDQTDAKQNGIYLAKSTAWVRADDANASADITAGMLVSVEEGTAQADSVWMLTTNDPIVMDTSALTFKRIDSGDALSLKGKLLDATVGTPAAGAAVVYDSGSGTYKAALIKDANVDSAAAIAVSKLAPGAAGRVLRTTGGLAAWSQLSASDFGETPITPATITGNQSNYSPTGFSDATIVRVQSNANNREINGLDATAAVKRKVLINIGSFTVLLRHDQPGQSAGNKIYTPTGGSYILGPNESVVVVHDATANVWWVVGPDLSDKSYYWTNEHVFAGAYYQFNNGWSSLDDCDVAGEFKAEKYYKLPAETNTRLWRAMEGYDQAGPLSTDWDSMGSDYVKNNTAGVGNWVWDLNGRVPSDVTFQWIELNYTWTGNGTSAIIALISTDEYNDDFQSPASIALVAGTKTARRLTIPGGTLFHPYSRLYRFHLTINGIPDGELTIYSAKVQYGQGVVYPA